MKPTLPLLASLIAGTAGAQTPSPPPPACAAAEHRQFDFWLGDWTVTRPDTGAVIGQSSITPSSAGCALLEHWRGGTGYEGRSLNVYDRRRGAWRQFWIGADGNVLELEGGLREGRMVLEGVQPGADGKPQRQRITWTPAEDGSVSQHWETSDDEGKTWATSFLGIYRRAGAD